MLHHCSLQAGSKSNSYSILNSDLRQPMRCSTTSHGACIRPDLLHLFPRFPSPYTRLQAAQSSQREVLQSNLLDCCLSNTLSSLRLRGTSASKLACSRSSRAAASAALSGAVARRALSIRRRHASRCPHVVSPAGEKYSSA